MSRITKTVATLGIAGLAAMLAAPAAMAEKGDWIIRGGATMVDPKSNNLRLGDLNDEAGDPLLTDTVLNVDDATSFGLNITYMLTDNLGVELLAAYPFTHDINLCATIVGEGSGCGTFAEVDQLPPTLSLQYRFMPDSRFQPYIGAGINFTMFSDEKFTSDLQEVLGQLGIEGADLKLDDSTGFAAQIGADFFFGENWLINVDIRYVDLSSDVEICVEGICEAPEQDNEVKIDPMVYSIMVGYRF